jgi:hypothetical protein
MPGSPTDRPKYLSCARALALVSGLAAGATGCGSSLPGGPTDGGSKDTSQDLVSVPYDGGVHGVQIMPDAGPPYDGGVFGLFINPDAQVGSDAHTTPYDGGVIGLRINPDANQG